MRAYNVIEADRPPEGEFIQVEDWNIHYVQAGHGPDIVLIHGAGGSTRDMTFRLLPRLAGSARVTAIDRPAHGWTTGIREAETISPQDQAALLLKVIDALGLVSPVVLGQSYGGSVALAMALQDPCPLSGLCLVSAAVTDAIPSGAQSLELLTRLETIRSATLATISSPRFTELALMKLFAPQAVPDGYAGHIDVSMSFRERTFRHHMLQASGLSRSLKEMMPHYGRISVPVEIIHGDADTILDHEKHAAWLARRIAGARLTILPGVGHMPHQVAVDDVVRCVFRTLSDR